MQGYHRENLYNSRTPKKGVEEDVGEHDYKPKLCEKSKFLDNIKKKPEMPRHEMLNRIVGFTNRRVRSIPTGRRGF